MRKNAPNRNGSAALGVLFPAVRRDVLATTLAHPEKWWYLSELAAHLNTSPSSLQRELASLVRVGILEQRNEGRRTYYRAQRSSPTFRDLRNLFERTAGTVAKLRDMLTRFNNQITMAFVYGSIARREEHAVSDIDLMIIGSVGLTELSPALRRTEKLLGREVNVTNYSEQEFRRRAAQDDHFLTSVLKQPKLFVKGSEIELDKLISE